MTRFIEKTPLCLSRFAVVALILLAVFALASCTGLDTSPNTAPTVRRDWNVPPSAPQAQPYAGALRERLRLALVTMPESYSPRTDHLHEDGSPVYTNRLVLESSPYLLQHAHNPVNWYPWGDEAFADAERLGRPVLLSIGYSTCHWCHVMEKESFEDVEIASFINANFIAVKVDREERPDVDAVYMDAVNILTGRGGWPMTVVLTPAREPFFAGTYFPARDGDRGSRRGFLTILKTLAQRYREDPDSIVDEAARLTQRMQSMAARIVPGELPDRSVFSKAKVDLARSFDSVYGGFGSAPKFPRSVTLDLLLRYYRRSGDREALEMVLTTLKGMANGGMYDQVGGGFHRYSTDPRWLVPHFEKMLYDNAQLVAIYLDAYQITAEERFAEVARQILDYVVAEMTDEYGGFFSATDADSPVPGGHQEEGWFFTWAPSEIDEVLDKGEADLVKRYYGVTDEGNFEGRNILHVAVPLEQVAQELGLSKGAAQERLDKARARLYQRRALRPPPGKDTKVITAWNGLMISAFARGGRVLEVPAYIDAATRAAVFLTTKLAVDGRLQRISKGGQANHDGVLDDYAFLVAGLLDLFETTFDRRWLSSAMEFQTVLQDRFLDADGGGFFFTADDGEALLTREKPYYDGARPSGNGIAASNLMRLYEYTTDERYRETAERVFSAFAHQLERFPTATPRMLSALDFYFDSPKEVIIVKPSREADAGPFMKRLRTQYLPNCIVAVAAEGDEVRRLSSLLPLVEGKVAIGGKVTAYVCEKKVCKFPTSSPEKFASLIATVQPY